jgi:hypothetical protein
LKKTCQTCKSEKELGEFFAVSSDMQASEIRTSVHCKQCHGEAKVPHGYGWYGDKYKTPEETGV